MKRKQISIALPLLGALALGYIGVAGQDPVDPLPGEVDLSFEPGSAINGSIRTFAPYGEGEWIIGGNFTAVHGDGRRGLARLNGDGSVDDSFLEGLPGVEGTVLSVAVQPDGKILVGGSFQTINGQGQKNLARLHPDGTVDTAFDVDVDRLVKIIVLENDDTILIGGEFTEVNDNRRNRLARLNLDGALDADFSPSFSDGVNAIAIQENGKIVVGGKFGWVNTLDSGRYLARLHADGTLDDSFMAGGTEMNEWVSNRVETVSLQSDGRILIGGWFGRVGGEFRAGIARLEADGALDPTFGFDSNPYGTEASFGAFTDDGSGKVRSIVLEDEEKILIGGRFSSVNGESQRNLARLHSDGTLDDSFAAGLHDFEQEVFALSSRPSGKIMVAGRSVAGDRIARLNAAGSVDGSFFRGVPGVQGGTSAEVRAIAPQEDGAVLIGGIFSSVQRHARGGIARLSPGGLLDEDFGDGLAGAGSPMVFDPTLGERVPAFIPSVAAITLQSDGKILAGGRFTSMNGEPRNGITRLNPDGSLDETFGDGMDGVWREEGYGYVSAVIVQDEEQILIGGNFDTVNGVPWRRIARLNGDGTLDHTFGDGFPDMVGTVRAIALQEDGKVLIAGSFTSINGAPRNRIARLHADGSLDKSFLSGLPGADSTVSAISVQPDGRILIAGSFTTINGQPRGRIARLHADGSLDVTFGEELGGADGAIQAIALQHDGRIIIGGKFGAVNGLPKNHIARLYPNGALDASFGYGTDGIGDLGWFFTARVAVAVLQDDGNVLIGGNFTVLNRTGLDRIARLYGGRLAAGYQGWTALLPDGRRDADDDPGGHGIPNVLRYAFGMDPLEPEREKLPRIARTTISDEPRAPQSLAAGETASRYLTLTYTRRTDDPALVYHVEASGDLRDWVPFAGTEEVVDNTGGETERVIVTGTEPMDTNIKRFIRVRVDR